MLTNETVIGKDSSGKKTIIIPNKKVSAEITKDVLCKQNPNIWDISDTISKHRKKMTTFIKP
jgi:hypothetical protein